MGRDLDTTGWPDELKAEWAMHKARIDSIDDQLGQLVEESQKARHDINKLITSVRQLDSYFVRALRLGVKEARQERVRRQQLRREMLARQQEQAERQQEHAERLKESDARLTRIERAVERRFTSGNGSSSGSA